MTSRWTSRQQALLAEMGVRLWAPPHRHASASPAERAVTVPGGQEHPDASAVTETAEAAPRAAPMPSRTGPSADRDAGIDSMDWPALRAAVAGCTACALCDSRTNTVFGTGNPRARWMIVGEAPGEQEDLRGEPFVGKSGQLLDNMLAALDLTRADDSPQRQVFIANALKCRPPRNRNPEPEELARCEPFLIRQIELVQPSVILAMGRFAVQALLRSSEPIGRLRGRVHLYREVPLVVPYHPAYLLRNLQDKARAWEDLCLAREVVAGTKNPAQAGL